MRGTLSLLVAILVVFGPAGWSGAQAPRFKSAIDLVNFSATVSDGKGVLVANLQQDDFEIFEDGRRQAVRYFAVGEGDPAPDLHIGLLLDASGSMGEDIAFTRTAAIKFVNTLADAVDVTMVDFDSEVRVSQYARSELPRLVERIRLRNPKGMTALYDAIGVYLHGAAAQDGRKIMLVYTDGGDTRSSIRFGELIDLLKTTDATVYAIGALGHQSSSARGPQRAVLEQIADATAGRAFFPTSHDDLDRAYAQIVSEIRAQYLLGYESTNGTADGSWRKVEVRVGKKDDRRYRVRARRGYFAPYRKPSP